MPTVSPSSPATSSAASRQPVAPSLSPAALPAVTLPCGRKGVRSVARPARGVSGRGGSSTGGRPQPGSGGRGGAGTSSGAIWPLATALAYLFWLARAEAAGPPLGRGGERGG